MLKVGITGIDGFIGWHLRCKLFGQPDIEIIPATRATFENPDTLVAFAKQCDAVVHLAWVSGGDDNELETTNQRLAQSLVDAFELCDQTPHLIFASSIQIFSDSAYGRSKRHCTELFAEWAHRTGAVFTCLVLPQVFGEDDPHAERSPVDTLCRHVPKGLAAEGKDDGVLELAHAQSVAHEILRHLKQPTAGNHDMPGRPISIPDLHERLMFLSKSYKENIIPNLYDLLNLQLLNTYRSHLYPQHYPVSLERHTDPRGDLFEAVKGHNGGQTFISTSDPGVTRGNHFHLTQLERFLIVRGTATLRIRKMFSDSVQEFELTSDTPQFIDIPTLHTYSITNTGPGELLTLFWSNGINDPENPDTFDCEVQS